MKIGELDILSNVRVCARVRACVYACMCMREFQFHNEKIRAGQVRTEAHLCSETIFLRHRQLGKKVQKLVILDVQLGEAIRNDGDGLLREVSRRSLHLNRHLQNSKHQYVWRCLSTL